MGCSSHRKGAVEVRPEQKWDYISLGDFKSTSCFTPLAYGYLYISLLISLAVYAVDIFTAVSLLALNTWPSEIALTQLISFDISKWIFSVCIILSIINLLYEHIRARRVMRRGSVAECFLDNLAVRLESIRVGKGQGWKRFLVFAELTKSKKGAEYIALFTYFNFQSWMRVVLCSGPRQVVNALTLLAVYNAKISASGSDVGNTLVDFFSKIRDLAQQDSYRALILSGMLFTLIVWVFSMLALILAVLFFVFFLWGYIPRADGGLSGFCSRKVNKRLMKIVTLKVNKAIAEEERKRQKAEYKAAKKAGVLPREELKATIPDVGGEDKLPEMPMLNRNDTMTTLPAYTSRPGSPGSFELGSMDQKRPPMPSRTGTMTSSASGFSARAPLLNHAAEPGYGRNSPAPSIPSLPDVNGYPQRTGTAASNRSFGGPAPPGRMMTNGSGFSSQGNGYSASPATYTSESMPTLPQPIRSPVGSNGYGRPGMPPPYASNGMSNLANGRASPAPSVGSYRGRNGSRDMTANGNPYPVRSATGPVPPRGPPYPQQRNMTAPLHRQQGSNDSYDYFNRPPTADSQRSPNRPQYGNDWNGDVEAQRRPGPRY